jgi:hypothetical protein
LTLVHSRTGSGLIVAEYGADGAAVLRALKEYDRSLVLLPPGVDMRSGADRQHWRVYAKVSDDRPPTFVLAWTDENGDPLPLSMRILDKVKEHDRNTRGRVVDPDDHNRRRRHAIESQAAKDREALREEHLRAAKSFRPAHRSVGLRMSRDKQRAKGRKV